MVLASGIGGAGGFPGAEVLGDAYYTPPVFIGAWRRQ